MVIMRRREHIRGQRRIFDIIGIRPRGYILEEINRSKDLFSNYPRKIDGRWLGPKLHRGHEHGVFTNGKWAVKYGLIGWIISVLHNFQDRRYSNQLMFIPERVATWYLGKLLDQLLGFPILRDGVVSIKRM